VKKLLLSTLFLLPCVSFATWQIAGSPETTGHYRFKNADDIPNAMRINPRYTLHVHKGSLKSNLMAYLKKHRWHLIWKVSSHDYEVHTDAVFTGKTLESVLTGFMKSYPHLTITFMPEKLTAVVEAK